MTKEEMRDSAIEQVKQELANRHTAKTKRKENKKNKEQEWAKKFVTAEEVKASTVDEVK